MKFLRFLGRHSSVILTIIWVAIAALAIATPLLVHVSRQAGVIGYSILRPLCHQASERSFHIAGYKMGLCARCSGLFIGLSVFGIAALIIRPARKIPFYLFVLTLAVFAADGIGNLFGLWNTGNILRFATGLVCAFGIVFWIYPIIFMLERGDYPLKGNE